MSLSDDIMNVLYLLEGLDRGGAETQALDVCRNAKRHGINLVFATQLSGALEGEIRGTGIPFYLVRRKLSYRFPVDITVAYRLRKLIKEHKIQIVHGYQPIDGINLFLATRGLRNVKKVLSFQGFIQDSKHRRASQFLVSRMDANISVSNGLAKILQDEDGVNISKNFHTVYNGADPARIAPSGKSVRAELNIDPNAIVFGMTANFYRDRRKDQITICKALPKVFSQLGNAHFIFAGGIERGAEEKAGECMRICREAGISDRVSFLGSRNDVADILKALDVYVFSSYYEGLPVAVTEAMLAGVPMIVSDIEALREATGNGEYAEIFPVEDVETLSQKMLALAADEGARRTQAELAQQFARDNFSIDAHFRELKKIYEKLL